MSVRKLNLLTLGLAAVLLTAVGVSYARRGGVFTGAGAPDDPETKTFWYCHHCRRGFPLTAREYDRRLLHGYVQQPAAGGADVVSRPVSSVRCPECGQRAVAARQCMTDGEIFDPRPPDGSAGACPKCGWNPLGS